MRSRYRNRPLVVFTFCGLALVALACGSESSGRKYDGGSPGAGGAGAFPQTSVGSGGAVGAGGVLGSGGVVGAGGGAGTGAVDATDVVVPLDSGPDAPALDAGLDAALDAPALDAGLDAALDAPGADAGVDSAGQPCGDAACSPGQACVLKGGGPVPPCDPPSDAGTCPDWMVLVASCGGSYAAPYRQPGCTTPPPSPRCYDVPGACEDLCSCVCGLSFGFGCNPGPGYYFCSYP
jgi:hypothetical protein